MKYDKNKIISLKEYTLICKNKISKNMTIVRSDPEINVFFLKSTYPTFINLPHQTYAN